MNIADGEYDIDLSVLIGNGSETDSDTSSLAVRYGFIPDSMDQSSVLHLYQGDQICILEASSSEKLKQTDALPIIFEGVPQRQRPQAAASAPNDSYYLSFTPKSDAMGAEVTVALRKLGSTIRVSKSRNAEKWRASIREWRKQASSGHTDVILPSHKSKPDVSTNTVPAASVPAKAPVTKKKAPKKAPRPASKRPPAKKPQNNDIISVSDFEDLGSDDDGDFQNEHVTKGKVENSNLNIVTDTGKSAAEKTASSISVSKNNDHDLDDEWADLEDQLEEVLESDQASKHAASFDSDEDSASEDVNKGEPIIIDVKEEKKAPHHSMMPRFGANRTPMSLRQLHGSAEANDYLSSSEEE